MRRRSLVAYVLAILALPFLVLWRQDNVLFTRTAFIDPWFYVGYAKNLLEFKRDLFPQHYTGSRLAWILPCWAIHSVFPPVVAAYVLHLGVWTLAVVSLFFILRRIVGERGAFLTAVLAGTHSWLWYAVGWDYPDGAAIACFLLATLFYTRAAGEQNPRWWLVAAGLAGAAALHCNLGWAGLAPLFPLPYLGLAHIWNQRPVRRSLGEAVLWSGAGGLALTVILGIVNYQLDGNFWFFMPSYDQGRSLAGQRIPWLQGVWGAGGLATHLWMPAAVSLLALACLVRLLRRREAARSPISIFAMQCFYTILYLSYFQRTEAHGLSYNYYASYMMPFGFLLLGTVFFRDLQNVATRTWMAICATAIAACGFFWFDYKGVLVRADGWAGVIGVAAVLLLAGGMLVRRPVPTCLLAIAGFAALTAGGRYIGSWEPHLGRLAYEQLMHAQDRADRLRQGSPLYFWFDAADPLHSEFQSLPAMYIQAQTYRDNRFPALSCDATSPPEVPLVAISSRPDSREEARRVLAACGKQNGLMVESEAIGDVPTDFGPFYATFLKLLPDPAVWRPTKLVFDGAPLLQPADSGDAALPENGWRTLSDDAQMRPVPGGLEVRTPADPIGMAVVYTQFTVPVTGRYRFELKYKLHDGRVLIGLAHAVGGEFLAAVSAGGLVPRPDHSVLLVDLKRGQAVQIQITNHHGAGRGAASFLLRETHVWMAQATAETPK